MYELVEKKKRYRTFLLTHILKSWLDFHIDRLRKEILRDWAVHHVPEDASLSRGQIACGARHGYWCSMCWRWLTHLCVIFCLINIIVSVISCLDLDNWRFSLNCRLFFTLHSWNWSTCPLFGDRFWDHKRSLRTEILRDWAVHYVPEDTNISHGKNIACPGFRRVLIN